MLRSDLLHSGATPALANDVLAGEQQAAALRSRTALAQGAVVVVLVRRVLWGLGLIGFGHINHVAQRPGSWTGFHHHRCSQCQVRHQHDGVRGGHDGDIFQELMMIGRADSFRRSMLRGVPCRLCSAQAHPRGQRTTLAHHLPACAFWHSSRAAASTFDQCSLYLSTAIADVRDLRSTPYHAAQVPTYTVRSGRAAVSARRRPPNG